LKVRTSTITHVHVCICVAGKDMETNLAAIIRVTDDIVVIDVYVQKHRKFD
jgi:hypothetical protein